MWHHLAHVSSLSHLLLRKLLIDRRLTIIDRDGLTRVTMVATIDQREGFGFGEDVVEFVLERQRVRMGEIETDQSEVLLDLAIRVDIACILDQEVASFEFRVLLAQLLLLSMPGEGADHAARLHKVLMLLHLVHVDAALETEEGRYELEFGTQP